MTPLMIAYSQRSYILCLEGYPLQFLQGEADILFYRVALGMGVDALPDRPYYLPRSVERRDCQKILHCFCFTMGALYKLLFVVGSCCEDVA